MKIVDEIVDAIRRHPHINRVVVSPLEHAKIRREISHMIRVKPQKRPTYGGPFGDVDRLLWDNLVAMKRLAPVYIMGRLIEIRTA